MSEVESSEKSRELVNKTLDELEKLKYSDDLTYYVSIFKPKGEKRFNVKFNIDIEMKGDDSTLYLKAIKEVHDKIYALGYWNIRLNSGQYGNGNKSTIMGERNII